MTCPRLLRAYICIEQGLLSKLILARDSVRLQWRCWHHARSASCAIAVASAVGLQTASLLDLSITQPPKAADQAFWCVSALVWLAIFSAIHALFKSYHWFWAPIQLLDELCRVSDGVSAWLVNHDSGGSKHLCESCRAADAGIHRRAARQDAWTTLIRPVNSVRTFQLLEFGLLLLSVALLLSVQARAMTSYCGGAFSGLAVGSSPLRHLYFTLVTFVTLGYGDIYPLCNNDLAHAFVMATSALSLLFLAFGVSLMVSGSQRLFDVLDRELDGLGY